MKKLVLYFSKMYKCGKCKHVYNPAPKCPKCGNASHFVV